MNYIKIGDMKYYLDGIEIQSDRVILKVKDDNYIFNNIRQDFSNLDDGITIYGTVIQEDGTETDEYIAQQFPNYTMLYTIAFDITSETYEITIISADNLEMRVTALEIMVNEILFGSLDEELQLEPLNEETTDSDTTDETKTESSTDSSTTEEATDNTETDTTENTNDNTSNEDKDISIDQEVLN